MKMHYVDCFYLLGYILIFNFFALFLEHFHDF